MFEEEAEKYTKQRAKVLGINDLNLAYHAMQRAYQYGAEFGYNKAKEEMQEQGLALQSDMDKTIEQNIALKKQIEKMKCCGNCKYSAQETVYSIVCKVGGVNKGEIENVEDCLVCDKWEIKEND